MRGYSLPAPPSYATANMVINYNIPKILPRSDYVSPFDLKKPFVCFFQIFVCVGATGLNMKRKLANNHTGTEFY